MAIGTINPANGALLKSYELLGDQQIEKKVRPAEEIFPKFRALSFAERGRMMLKAADILEAEKKEGCPRTGRKRSIHRYAEREQWPVLHCCETIYCS